MEKLLEQLVNNAPGMVGVIIVVVLFLKANKQFVMDMKEVSGACHERTKASEAAFKEQVREMNKDYREQIERMNEQNIKIADRYHEAIKQFGEAIGKNGEILNRMEKNFAHRRSDDPAAQRHTHERSA